MDINNKYNKLELTKLYSVLLLAFLLILKSNFLMAADAVWFDSTIHHTNKIEVKFLDDSTIESKHGKLFVSHNTKINRLNFAKLNNISGNWQPIFDASLSTLKQWRTEATQKSSKPLADLSQFFYLNLSDNTDTATLIATLRASPLIEGAYPVAKAVEPPLPPDYEYKNDSNITSVYGNMYQRYFNAAPDGIDLHYARQGVGGKGAGVSICDIEYGWLNHTDHTLITNLKNPDLSLPDNFYPHGTAVLGMLGSKDNGWGTTGMVSESPLYFSPSIPQTTGSLNVANAISTCINQLSIGDVILIEQQTLGQNGNFVPVEWSPAVYNAIKTATELGYVVIEAAGNGNEDLDDVFYGTAQPFFSPFTAANDSGAIIVGSANSAWTATPLTRIEGSTYGDTVDLHAWGHDIIATGYGNYYNDEGDSLNYTLFGGTSGASPMVTAAATIIQANYIAKNGSPATPATIKQLLRSTGTPQASVNGENIGPMPDLKSAIDTLWNVATIEKPIITPASGTYQMPMQVTIAYGSGQSSANTHIRYTLNGSEPTEDSFVFLPDEGDSIYLNYGVNIKAKAFQSSFAANRLFSSDTESNIYVSTTPKVVIPQISPNGGDFVQSTPVVITTTTPGATIKYRKDGRAPSAFYPGTVYSGPITLGTGSFNITAKAYKDGYYKSDTAYAAQLTISPVTLTSPTIYPNSGSFNGEVTVYLGSTILGATIRYTTNGSEPTSTSVVYANPIVVNSDTTVKAKVYLDGYTPSSSTSNSYTIIGQAAAPVISPGSGATANDSLLVTLSTSTVGAHMRYTRNGTEPTNFSTLYSGAITLLPGQHTIKAKSYVAGADPSSTSTASFTVFDTSITVSPPKINPVGGIFNAPVTITMTSDTANITLIFYTLDGSDPATSASVQPYNGPFDLPASNTSYFIKARAYLSGSGNSEISSATFTIVDPALGPVATPTITPDSGTYHNTIAVSVQAPDFSSPFNIRKLYVTRNGDLPISDFSSTGSGASGTYNFNLSKPESVQALAAQAGWFDSQVTAKDYSFKCATPEISEGGTFVDSTNVTISTLTTNSTIYYTLDGSEPTSSNLEYTSPLTITQDQVIKAICVRNNFDSSETQTSVFIINPTPVAPAISVQPLDLKINTCGAALFSVIASGTETLHYQWYKDGNVIGDAIEPELEIIEVNPEDSGNYYVEVSNDTGTVNSDTVTLIVPIFSSGFESGEVTNACITTNRSSKQLQTTNKTTNNSLQSEIESVNLALSENRNSNLINGLNRLQIDIASNKSGKENNDMTVKGSQLQGAQVIPTLSNWAKYLLLFMMLTIVYYIKPKLIYRK